MAEQHKKIFSLTNDEAASFNKDQRIVIIGSEISSNIREAATFLRHKCLRVTCIEFSYFRSKTGEQLLSMDIVIGKEPIITDRIIDPTNRARFLNECDDNGKVFMPILDLESIELPIHWGSRGFSLNVYHILSECQSLVSRRGVNMRGGVPQQKTLYIAMLCGELGWEKGAKSSWHKTVKRDCIRPLPPRSLEDAWRIGAAFVYEYNNVRLRIGIGYVVPQVRLAGRDRQIVAERRR